MFPERSKETRSPPVLLMMRPTSSSDKALARRLTDGDEAAFEEFFESYFQRLFRFALARLGNDVEAAREAVQAVLCKAVNKLDTYRGEASLFTWLCSICRYEILDQRRARSKVELIDDHPRVRAALFTLASSESEHPETGLERREIVRLVHATLDHLPARYGSALEMRYLEGRSVDDIAARLELGYKATESLLSRAREAFRKGFAAVAEAAAPVRSGAGGRQGFLSTTTEGASR